MDFLIMIDGHPELLRHLLCFAKYHVRNLLHVFTFTVDETYCHLKEEADSARGQVDFLNSVIVELQSKNQELHQRLAAMEDSGVHTNGEFSEPTE